MEKFVLDLVVALVPHVIGRVAERDFGRLGEALLVEFHDLVMELGLDFTDGYLGIFVKLYDCGGFVAYFAGCGDIEFHD